MSWSHAVAMRCTVQPDLVGPAIAGVGLNTDQLMADMNAPEVAGMTPFGGRR